MAEAIKAEIKSKVLEAVFGGKSTHEVAHEYGLHPTTIAKWVKRVEKEGLEKVLKDNRVGVKQSIVDLEHLKEYYEAHSDWGLEDLIANYTIKVHPQTFKQALAKSGIKFERKGRQPNIKPDERDAMVELFNSGVPIMDIALKFKRPYGTVSTVISRVKNGYNPKYNVNMNRIHDLYKEGKTTIEIAEIVHLSLRYVYLVQQQYRLLNPDLGLPKASLVLPKEQREPVEQVSPLNIVLTDCHGREVPLCWYCETNHSLNKDPNRRLPYNGRGDEKRVHPICLNSLNNLAKYYRGELPILEKVEGRKSKSLTDRELQVLSLIEQSPDITYREISSLLSIDIDSTMRIVKRLVGKGIISTPIDKRVNKTTKYIVINKELAYA